MSAVNDASANVGTVRTTVNVAISAFLSWLAFTIFDVEVEVNDPIYIALVSGLAAVVYRLSRLFTHHFPQFAWLLFGIGDAPKYLKENE